ERLAYSYFKGSDEFRQQIKAGNLTWMLDRLKEVPPDSDACNESERGMLRDLEIVQKYMQQVMRKSNDKGFANSPFYAQAHLLAGGILSKIKTFSKILEEFYDRCSQA
ncbi:MAG: chromosome partitioning protein ParB, partial [bacterium]|nr:chromosome partitioning protein ParB [bacterium]